MNEKREGGDSADDRGKVKQSDTSAGGEDESSTEKDGDDSHLHDDQKSRRLPM